MHKQAPGVKVAWHGVYKRPRRTFVSSQWKSNHNSVEGFSSLASRHYLIQATRDATLSGQLVIMREEVVLRAKVNLPHAKRLHVSFPILLYSFA